MSVIKIYREASIDFATSPAISAFYMVCDIFKECRLFPWKQSELHFLMMQISFLVSVIFCCDFIPNIALENTLC